MRRDGPVVVTGVGGLIGSHVARLLHERGLDVVACDSFITGSRRNVPPAVRLLEGDCRDLSAMNELCAGAQIVIHCAATPYEGLSIYSPCFVADHIFNASVAVFTAAIAQGVRRVVNLSSMARYGEAAIPFDEEQAPKPVDPYGVAKVGAELMLQSLSQLHGLEYVIAVPHNVVGPGQRYDDVYRNVAAIMINRMLSGDEVLIYGDGNQRRCFTHVEDVAEQIIELAFASGVSRQVFNLGRDTGFITINELARRIAAHVGQDVPVRHLPARHGEVRDATCSHAKIQRLTGCESERTLDDALIRLIAEIRELGTRPLVPDLPLEIRGPRVPETWLPPATKQKKSV
jgi:UDP-glucose 4-epimerase